MDELDNVFEALKAAKLCKSKYRFSREYLGRAPNYYSAIKATNTEPSTHALMTLYFMVIKRIEALNKENTTNSTNNYCKLLYSSNEVFKVVQARCSSQPSVID